MTGSLMRALGQPCCARVEDVLPALAFVTSHFVEFARTGASHSPIGMKGIRESRLNAWRPVSGAGASPWPQMSGIETCKGIAAAWAGLLHVPRDRSQFRVHARRGRAHVTEHAGGILSPHLGVLRFGCRDGRCVVTQEIRGNESCELCTIRRHRCRRDDRRGRLEV